MTEDSVVPDRAVLYCPHCGNTSVQTHMLSQDYRHKFLLTADGSEFEEPAIYHIVRCESCVEILVYSYCHLSADEETDTQYGELVYPKQTVFTKAVPERIRKAYMEAAKVKNLSATAFVVLARRVLEEIANDKGIVNKTLAASLTELAKLGELPPVLAQASALIRIIGNAGAHAGKFEVNATHVWPIDDFLKAVIEYLYVAPSKVAEFQKSFKTAEVGADGG